MKYVLMVFKILFSLDYYISVNIEDIFKMKKSNRKLCPCSFHDLLNKNTF